MTNWAYSLLPGVSSYRENGDPVDILAVGDKILIPGRYGGYYRATVTRMMDRGAHAESEYLLFTLVYDKDHGWCVPTMINKESIRRLEQSLTK